MKKSVVLFVLLLAVVMTAQTVAADPVEIEFWHALTGDYAKVLEQLVVEYNEAHEGQVHVNSVYKGNYQDIQKALLAGMAAGETPDVSHLSVSFSATMAAKGVLAPITEFDITQEELDAIFPGFMDAVSIDGVMYAMPFNMSVPVLYYNADMLAAAGIEAPQTWDEFAAACKALTDDSHFGFTVNPGNVWVFEAMVMQNGGSMFNEDYTEVRFNSEEGIGAMQFLVDLVEAGAAKSQSWEEGRTEFFNGNVAFMEDSNGSLSGVLNNCDFKVGVIHLPWGKVAVTTIGGGTMGIFDNDKKETSWDFLKFMTSPESVSRIAADTGYMPNSKLAMEVDPLKDKIENDEYTPLLLESLPYTSTRPMINGYSEIEQLIRNAIEEACLLQKSAADAMNEAAEGAAEVLANLD